MKVTLCSVYLVTFSCCTGPVLVIGTFTALVIEYIIKQKIYIVPFQGMFCM